MKLLITEKPSVAMEFAKVLNINGKKNNGFIEGKDWMLFVGAKSAEQYI